MARSIAREVDITLTPLEEARLASTRPVNAEAHQRFLLGRFHADKGTEEGLRKAMTYFEQAIAKDPGGASAYAGLADAYTSLGFFHVHPREAMPKARAAAASALKLDESLADAHAALGAVHLFYDWDGPAAERELRRAIQLNPSLASARLSYAGYLLTAERPDDSVRENRLAIELDPLSVRTRHMSALFLLFARRYEESIEQARKGLELDPGFAFGDALQGLARAEEGRFDEAVPLLQKAVQAHRHPSILAFGAHVHAVAGRKDKAKRLLEEAEAVEKQRYFCPYEIATAYVSLADHDTAFKWFRKGVEDRADCMAWLGVEPWVNPFRSDPRTRNSSRKSGWRLARCRLLVHSTACADYSCVVQSRRAGQALTSGSFRLLV